MLHEIKRVHLWITRIMKIITFLIMIYRIVNTIRNILNCKSKATKPKFDKSKSVHESIDFMLNRKQKK